MGAEKKEKRKMGVLRCLNSCGAMAIGASLLFLLYLVGCVKTVPQEDIPSPESKAPIASKIEQETSAAATPVVEAAVPVAAEPEPVAIKEKSPAPRSLKSVEERAFHLKAIEELTPQEPEKTTVSPKILEDQTMETKMPQRVAELAAKSKMYHPVHSPIKEGESCVSAKCHIEMVKVRYVHAPVATGACLICHTNIKKDPPFGLVSTGVDLCWRCHKNQKLLIGQSKYLHKIVKDEGCIGCHDSHGSKTTKFLLNKDELTLCVDCHKKKTEKVMEQIASATVVHKPVAEGRCAGCHAPHASNYNKLLKGGPKDVALCFSCHKKMEQQTKNALYKHGPVQQEICSTCHEPHAGYVAKNLKYNFDKKFYNPFDLEVYSLCFKCHKETVVLDKRTTYLTNFRNGDRNLHFLHVNREKGRTCVACHEVHMGSQRRHIRKLTPFGTWEIPINFTLTPTGGKCSANCHIPKEYDRENPVKLMIDEEEKNLEMVKK
jgi:predicted CXXCH cytochrome family protein